MSWNVRGVANVATMRRLRKLIRLHSLSLLTLYEPMVDSSRLAEVKERLGFPHGVHSVSNKIWVLWKSNLVVTLLHQSGQLMHFHIYLQQSSCLVTFIYAKCTRLERHQLWHDLSQLGQTITTPWMLIGDFNVSADLTEYSGRSLPDLGSMSDFAEFIHSG